MFAFSVISRYRNCTGCVNLTPRKQGAYFYPTVYIIVADELSTQRTRAWVTIVQTQFSWNISALTPHYSDVMTSALASQITASRFIYPIVCSGAYQRELQSSASLALVRGIHRWPVNSPQKGPVLQKMFPFDDVLMRMLKDLENYLSQITKKQHFNLQSIFYVFSVSRPATKWQDLATCHWNIHQWSLCRVAVMVSTHRLHIKHPLSTPSSSQPWFVLWLWICVIW